MERTMTEIRRWLDQDDVPEEVGDLLRAGRPSQRLPEPVRRRSARRVAALAAVPIGIGALILSPGTLFATLLGAGAGIAVASIGPVVFHAPEGPPREVVMTPSPSRPVAPVRSAAARADRPSIERASDPGPPPSNVVRPAPDTLASETELLERARVTLGSDPARALALVREHRARFPAAKLGVERDLIEVSALQRAGRSSDARDRLSSLRKRLKGSIYAARIDQLALELGVSD
jgi:hypothetical protein